VLGIWRKLDVDSHNIQAGMFAIRARRKVATERDFLDAVEKVVRQGTKFSST
jgi:26S proteasome regulatory subunit T1